MNELAFTPVNKIKPLNNNINYMFQNMLPLFLILFTFKSIPNLNKTINNILKRDTSGRFQFANLSPDKIEKGISIARKIGPYLPESVITLLNNIIPLVERVNKIMAVANLFLDNKAFEPIVPANSANSGNKIINIVSSLKDEIPQETFNKVKPLIDVVINFDKYKPLIEIITNLISPSETQSDKNQLDNIIDAIIPILSDKDDKTANKVKDMIQMIEMFKLLSSDDKSEKGSKE